MEMSLQKVTGFVEANGTSFYYEACGAGEALLLIHGLNLDTRMWSEQLAAFSERYRVISFDLRGMGRTPNSEGPFTLYDDARAVLQGLGIAEAHVIGHSFGSVVAQELVLAYPEMVKSLVLVSPTLTGYPRSERRMQDFARFVEMYETGTKEETVEMSARMWFDGPGQETREESLAARANYVRMTAHAYDLPQLKNQPAWLSPPPIERLEEIEVPALVIAGQKDYDDFQKMADTLAERMANAEKVLLPDSAHLPPMDQPAECNRLVLAFLDRVGRK
ncbi:alpha/beta fold hydrolase [Brevibacillus borstelensis]|uniref:alpha/beta fold hydrolase n=1 Tax=Brevibacillus borstelensis TaxID=45462 RepID=UPI0030C5C96D